MGFFSRVVPCCLLWLASTAAVLAQGDVLVEGATLFNGTCAHCHGGSGQGGTLGPSILSRVLEEDDAALAAFLRAGNPEKGMPPVLLPEGELVALMAHLRQL